MEILHNASFINAEGEEINANLEGKIVALYFSGSWCPPCRTFTPILREFYRELNHRKCPFEVIFASVDKTENDMMEYMRCMHGDWLALPFGSPLIAVLRQKLDVDMVPRLFVYHAGGSLITSMGRKEIQDKGVAAFRFWQDAAARGRVVAPKSAPPTTANA